MSSKVWWALLFGTLIGASVLTAASAPPRVRTPQQYRCKQQQNLIALERPEFVSLMVAGRSYELTWIDASSAAGHGLIWRVSKNRAALTRVSSGFTLAGGCARVAAQI